MPALRACNYCFEAAVPLAVKIVEVNRWTLLGSFLGLLIGLLIIGAARLRAQATPVELQGTPFTINAGLRFDVPR